MNKVLIYILMALGECFIIFTSFVFLKYIDPTNLWVLNTVILSIAYLLIYSIWFDVFEIVSIKSETSTSRLGALIWGSSIYFCTSLGVVICSYIFKWELIVAIWAQCAALLPLLLSIVVCNISGSAVANAIQQNEDRKLSLHDILNQFNTLELKVKSNPSKNQRKIQIDNIKEQLRYITYSNNPKAEEIEALLFKTILEMIGMSSSSLQNDREWNSAVERCFALISLRKQQP